MKLKPLDEEDIRLLIRALKNPVCEPDCDTAMRRLILTWIVARASFEFVSHDDEDTRLAYQLERVKQRVGWEEREQT